MLCSIGEAEGRKSTLGIRAIVAGEENAISAQWSADTHAYESGLHDHINEPLE